MSCEFDSIHIVDGIGGQREMCKVENVLMLVLRNFIDLVPM